MKKTSTQQVKASNGKTFFTPALVYGSCKPGFVFIRTLLTGAIPDNVGDTLVHTFYPLLYSFCIPVNTFLIPIETGITLLKAFSIPVKTFIIPVETFIIPVKTFIIPVETGVTLFKTFAAKQQYGFIPAGGPHFRYMQKN